MTDERDRHDGADSRTLDIVSSPGDETLRRLTAVGTALAGLLVLLGLAALLPGLDRLLAAVTTRPVALLGAVATVLIVGALVVAAPAVRLFVAGRLDGPDSVVADAAAAAEYLVGFVAVVIAYNGFAGALLPAFEAFGLGGVYHLAFLAAGLFALGGIARRLYHCWMPVTSLVAAYISSALGGRHNGAAPEK